MKHVFVLVMMVAVSACGSESAKNESTETQADTSATTEMVVAVDTEPSDDYATAVSRATTAIRRAAELGHVWTTSDQFLAEAEAANDARDVANAIRLADEARIHAELAIIQANREATAWRENIIGD
jgi:hypothetical protein